MADEHRFFAASDPQAKGLWFWPFVYYHRLAEDMNTLRQEEADWPWDAPDLVVCNAPMPRASGYYSGWLYGLQVMAVLAIRPGQHFLTGRIAALSDPVALAHAYNPMEWR